MKRNLNFALMIFFTSFYVHLNGQVNLNKGLLGYYPFTGNANDSSGNGNHGTVNDATLAKDRCGRINSAYSFDGMDDYIGISATNLQTQYFSYSLWVNASEIPDDGQYTYPFSIGGTGGGQNVALCNNSMTGWAGGAYNNGTPAISLVAKGSQPSINTWYHMVFIRDTTKIKLYINGILNTYEPDYDGVTCSTGTTTPNYGTSVTGFFGARNLITEFYFKGLVDDVRIYGRVITQDEVDSLYHEDMCFFTGLDEVMADNSKLRAYPNPSNGSFTIDIENSLNNAALRVVNAIGQEVYSGVINGSATINLSNMAAGIYTIILQEGSGTVTRKISILN